MNSTRRELEFRIEMNGVPARCEFLCGEYWPCVVPCSLMHRALSSATMSNISGGTQSGCNRIEHRMIDCRFLPLARDYARLKLVVRFESVRQKEGWDTIDKRFLPIWNQVSKSSRGSQAEQVGRICNSQTYYEFIIRRSKGSILPEFEIYPIGETRWHWSALSRNDEFLSRLFNARGNDRNGEKKSKERTIERSWSNNAINP